MDIILERDTTTQKMPDSKFEWLAHLLPQEIFQEILTRLPILSLIRCTSVCQTWRSMIINQSFIRAYDSRKASLANQNETHLLLLHRISGPSVHMWDHKTQISVHYDNDAFDEYPEVQFPRRFLKTYWSNERLRVVGTCNGLVCLADGNRGYDKEFFILNPTIRKIIQLPTPGLNLVHPATIGFGFDPTDNDYKVVRLVDVDDETTPAEVYSLATGSWRSLGNVSPACRIHGAASQAFVNGTLYWPAQRKKDCSCFLLAFDVGAKLFREVSLPESLAGTVDWYTGLQLSLSRDGKSLVLFATKASRLDIWVMKEDGMKESWSKLISLGRQGPQNLFPRGLLFRKSDQVLLSLVGFRDGLDQLLSSLLGFDDDFLSNISVHDWVSLNVESKELKDLGSCGYQYCTANYYEESLLLLDNTKAVSYEKFEQSQLMRTFTLCSVRSFMV